MKEVNFKKIVLGVVGVIALLFMLTYIGKISEDVEAGEIVVIQDPVDGELHMYTQPGMVFQNFGKATHYRKSFQYWFDGVDKEGHFPMIPTKFYDGGHASIPGSIRVDMPLDEKSLLKLHTKFGSQEAIETQLVGQILIKAISMSGPLMSSKESYAEKKNNFVYYIEDQASQGIYKTTQKDAKTIDPLTGQEKVITVVDIINDSKGLPMRQEKSMIIENGITLNNLSLGDFKYDDIVRKQIAAQQNATMQVQTAIANAKRAEQDALTVEQQGKADAAKAKWDQEVVKAKAVTEAEQYKEVAELDVKTANAEKQANILRGEGEAAYKRLVIQADGALTQKLEAYKFVMGKAWDAVGAYQGNWAPSIVSGNAGISNNNAMNFMDIISTKTLRDLSLDMSNKK